MKTVTSRVENLERAMPPPRPWSAAIRAELPAIAAGGLSIVTSSLGLSRESIPLGWTLQRAAEQQMRTGELQITRTIRLARGVFQRPGALWEPISKLFRI